MKLRCPKCGIAAPQKNVPEAHAEMETVLAQAKTLSCEIAREYLASSWLLAALALYGYCANHVMEVAAGHRVAWKLAVEEAEAALRIVEPADAVQAFHEAVAEEVLPANVLRFRRKSC